MDAVGPIFEGRAQAQQYTTQRALAEQQARDVDLQAVQTSEQRREQLRSSMSTIDANRVGAGLSIDSPTGQAIAEGVKARAQRSERIDRVGYLNQRQALQWQAAAYKKAAKNAITGSYIKGFTEVGKTAAKAAGM